VETLPSTILDSFFARLAMAPVRALLLDYDGTLAPFRVERDKAFPYAGVREALTLLQTAGRTRIVIISGRSVAELEQLLGIEPLPELWGSHGAERRLPDGTYRPATLNQRAQLGLQTAQQVIELQGFAGALERKAASLALHWRGANEQMVRTMRDLVDQLWTPLAVRYEFQLHPFDGGIELRLPGANKGKAAYIILDELGPEVALAYLGDDFTDEDAFLAIGHRGLRVLVRPEQRPSAADLWLRPPEELLAFLYAWVNIDTSQASKG
jgi:trehalose 6-phosphate phosphatase